MKRLRIGLMAGNKSIDYVRTIRLGVQNTLEEAGHILVAVEDLIPFHSRSNTISYFRVAFEVASRLNLDAIIVPAGIISGYLTDESATLVEFLSILGPAKTLVIERQIPGYRCVGKDSAPGMHACMRHLIETRGFKKIAFIRGPKSSTGAREREEIFLQEMFDHGLEVPPSMLGRGDYSGECGDSIDRLIDDNPGLEAIACSCDLIAHSVYRVMRRRGLSVGKDIAVTGFDDHVQSAHLDPPLSTVHMTGYDLGCTAAREAMRLCNGEPQKELKLSSTFIARGSCGEIGSGKVEQYAELIAERPFPQHKFVDALVDATLLMAGQKAKADFRHAMTEFMSSVRVAYLKHVQGEVEGEDKLFSSQDLSLLFNKKYREYLSIEGFQSEGLLLLQAIVESTPQQDMSWAIEQISQLNLGVARLLNTEIQEDRISSSRSEWTAFHVVDDALRESADGDSTIAYRLMLRDLGDLGIRAAHLYLLPDPVSFMGSRTFTFALSDTLLPIGHLCDGVVSVETGEGPIALQTLLDRVIDPDDETSSYVFGSIMAGNELLGVALLDSGTLDVDSQLIVLLNLGIALKHMQMIANERETNELLSKSNLRLEQQSHYDEMTGVLNRRGFMSELRRTLNQHVGELGALFYLDLDGLKVINDTYGHDMGDEAIRQTTQVLLSSLPPQTILGRLGGDEFVAFTLVKYNREIETLGDSVDIGIAEHNATHHNVFRLSISYGGVLIDIRKDTFDNISGLLVKADERLYKMKKQKGTGRQFMGVRRDAGSANE